MSVTRGAPNERDFPFVAFFSKAEPNDTPPKHQGSRLVRRDNFVDFNGRNFGSSQSPCYVLFLLKITTRPFDSRFPTYERLRVTLSLILYEMNHSRTISHLDDAPVSQIVKFYDILLLSLCNLNSAI